ncbi:TSL-kinase interacting 1 isoform X1 isoform A [Micractinium conductrix]|uniref:TSL-kinase interacting 1 isoform X1 isoform A n=1 Tax=Micractinium conductrix TaxID=554055 RepID=A0A2P6VMI9_9CHLO|nr:TSL-kinase interacting 1 isoform X1 isoform A [Micractinium conductrix]|eukprot:PSC75321.1 TSL-kinase interacting 1 isoform X1 isoform A [Micractinium conductrix]
MEEQPSAVTGRPANPAGSQRPAGEAAPLSPAGPEDECPMSSSGGDGEPAAGDGEDSEEGDEALAAGDDGDEAGIAGGDGDEEDAGGEGEAAAAAGSGGAARAGRRRREGQKREYVKWTPEEESVFYEALRDVAGQKPEACCKEVCQRLRGSKAYAQVRHYYYRLIKRLNKIMGPCAPLDIKNPMQVHRAMIKFWEVLQQQGMEGTCMVAIMKKPRKQKELSTTVQRGVRAVLRTSAKAGGGSAVGGGGARKRKTRGAEEGGGGAAAAAAAEGAKAAAAAQALAAMEQVQPDVDMTDVEAPPAKARRTTGRSTRLQAQALAVEQQQQQQQLEQQQASQQAAPPEGCGGTAVGGGAPVHGSSQSETGAHEGSAAVQQPASSSHTVGSQPPAAGQPVRGGSGAAHSFRSSSGAGASGVVLEGGSMGQASGKLRLQLMPLDGTTAAVMADAGLHPFLELTLGTGKSLASVLRHLATKWAAAAAGVGSSLPYVHPPADGPLPLRGVRWGGPDCGSEMKVGDIYSTLHCPTPFQLLYSWAGAAADTPKPRARGAARQTSSRATSQQQQRQQSARKDELTAALREAITAVAAQGPAQGPTPSQQQRQQQAQQQQAQQPGSFMQLLNSSDALAAAQPAGSMGMAAAPAAFMPSFDPATAAFAAVPPAYVQPPSDAAMAFVPADLGALPMGRYDQQPPTLEIGAAQRAVQPAGTARKHRSKARAAARAATAGGGGQPAQPDGSPAAAASDGGEQAAGASSDPRKPRGLLGLLQTPAVDKPARAARLRKAAPQRKTTVAGGRAGKGGGRQKKQTAAAAAAAAQQQQQQQQQQFGGVPLAPGFAHGHFTWALMQPQAVQQEAAVPVLQPAVVSVLQQQHAALQRAPAQHAQHEAPGGDGAGLGQPAPLEWATGGDTLMQFLDAHAVATAAAFPPGLSLFGSPQEQEAAGDDAVDDAGPPLPGTDDFSLKSWPSLSPPSNFQLPDGFDTGLSPLMPGRKLPAPGAGGAATLTGGGSAKPGCAGAAAAAAAAALGPTDFSMLLAGVKGSEAAEGGCAAPKQPVAVAPSRQQQQQQRLQAAQQAAPQQQQQQQPPAAVDTLFGGGASTLLGFLGPAGGGASKHAALPGSQAQGQAPGGGAVPPLQDKDLADLTFDFGSLLGVGDAAPSWLGPAVGDGGGGGARTQHQPQLQQQRQVSALGDRPFASLFGDKAACP